VFPLWQGCFRLKENIQAIFDTLISRTQLRDRMVATSARVDLGYPSSQVRSYFDSPKCAAELKCTPAHPQSQSSGRFPSHVIVSNLSSVPRSNSDSEPGITLADKNDIIEMGTVTAGKLSRTSSDIIPH
jgi:hypothetical protein